MISSFLYGAGGSCGVTQLISSFVSGVVTQPAISAAASSATSLKDTIANHGIENHVDVLRQCRTEVVVLSRVHHSRPCKHAVLRIEQPRFGHRPRRAVDLLGSKLNRLPVAVETDADRGAWHGSGLAIDADDPRDEHALGARPGDGPAQLSFIDLAARTDRIVAGDPFQPAFA